MDLYTQVLQHAHTLGWQHDWPDVLRVVERAVAPHPAHWRLPGAASLAAGGSSGAAIPVAIALAYMQIAIILIDDLLDEDPRGEHHRIGPGGAANLASAFQAAGLECIEQASLPTEARQEILACLNHMMGETSVGQYLDMQNPADEAAYWQVVQTKSSPFFGAALQAGALAGGAAPTAAEGLGRLGRLYGELVQLHDDLSDCLAIPASPDWHTGRAPLPFLFAEKVAHPERERFIALRRQVGDPQLGPAALKEAQAILVRCGAISYCIHHILERYRQALALLEELPLQEPAIIARLLEEMVDPIRELFAALQVKLV